jgi:allantoicase
MKTATPQPEFTQSGIDLAQLRLGAEAQAASDEFFAPRQRLILPAEPEFKPGLYDDHGKWMDGWESRRKRGPGHDWCIVKLCAAGVIQGVDIDTRHFTGNYPPGASLEACVWSGEGIPDASAGWETLVQQSPLAGDSHNWFSVADPRAWTHVRLNIFPDGGVARLRVYGRIAIDWSGHDRSERLDLAAMANGGRPVACNDQHYGGPGNLIAPGRGINMGDGWETRRRREPGHDWAILELCHRGAIDEIHVDTAHFKGNYPDRCSIQAADAGGLSDAEIIAQAEHWPVLLPEKKLQADSEHVFREGISKIGPVTHVRLNILPDGGVSRLRLFGRIA